MPRIINLKYQHPTLNSIYVGRNSKWGNPFVIGIDGTREEVVEKHDKWIETQPQLLAALSELTGKDLLCFCAPAKCHAETLMRRAN